MTHKKLILSTSPENKIYFRTSRDEERIHQLCGLFSFLFEHVYIQRFCFHYSGVNPLFSMQFPRRLISL